MSEKDTPAVHTRRLGRSGPEVSVIGLGCMAMSGTYGPADRSEAVATIHAALDGGLTLIDTADHYGMGHNEMLIGEAIRGRPRDSFLLSVKFGSLRNVWSRAVGFDCRPKAVKTFVAYSLTRLGVDHIDIYRPARLDPEVPIEDTVGAIADLVAAGYVRYIGLSEVEADTIERAAAVHPISDLQIEYSMICRKIDGPILEACRRHGIGITAFGVLARGLISGHWQKGSVADPSDARGQDPRFRDAMLERNLALVEAMRHIAQANRITVAQVAIAWVLAQGDEIVPILGARRRERLSEAIGAADVRLSADDVASIDRFSKSFG